MGQVGVIQIFVQLGKRLIHRPAKQIDLRGNGIGLGHLQFAGRRPLHLTGIDRLLLDQYQIIQRYLGPDDAALYKQLAVLIRQ